MSNNKKGSASAPAAAKAAKKIEDFVLESLDETIELNGEKWTCNGSYNKAKAESQRTKLEEHYEVILLPFEKETAVYFKIKAKA